ncbi:Soluble lytic murein transglycosylase [Rhizobium sp. RU20A]|uniref:lytic transglycosylase domain-containing protein n=1 Tax=Rhizobium sp. RU20A TaxID=1907412 RepID=UPI00095651E6|nr:lytic transglycosylase domain-containing protein [Rhizobium sp. RU20A]SIQ21506.1 Soluble lytic murein transglycosylase [Rhizobium sp. RU20A]
MANDTRFPLKTALAAATASVCVILGGCSTANQKPKNTLSSINTIKPAGAQQRAVETAAGVLPATSGQVAYAAGQVAPAGTTAAAANGTTPGVAAPVSTTALAAQTAAAPVQVATVINGTAVPGTDPRKVAPTTATIAPQALQNEASAASPAIAAANMAVSGQQPAAAPATAVSGEMAATAPATGKEAVRGQRLAALPIAASYSFGSVMESTFDTGEPVGLETLVTSQMIVPMARPDYRSRKPQSALTFSADGAPTSSRPELDKLIAYYAKLNQLPLELVHRVVKRESTYNPRAYARGNYGLMQIRYNTARGLGYDGPPEGLFDAETNLKYATRYLRGAFIVADNSHDNAVKLYARGYYYDAKRKGLLDQLDMR